VGGWGETAAAGREAIMLARFQHLYIDTRYLPNRGTRRFSGLKGVGDTILLISTNHMQVELLFSVNWKDYGHMEDCKI